jgi:hypothetical protein
MRKLFLICLLVLTVSAFSSQSYYAAFLDTAVDVGAGMTKVNVTDFTSKSHFTPVNTASITITFTRAAGSASTVDFYFQVSFDGGTTWANYRSTISVPTNEPVISGTTCRVLTPVNLYGVSHIRLWKIVNGDVGNALTAVNATISY